MAPPPGSVPPPLAPSVEEAYKRKCQQLKRRMNEVEESNDAAYVRVTRLRREIEKVRLERVFLLDQLTRRTATNVEDSEGSPSPPATPQEKPLRTKRGHRKPESTPSINTNLVQAAPSIQNNLSPTSDTYSQAPESQSRVPIASTSASQSKSSDLSARQPVKSGYDLFYNDILYDHREELEQQAKSGAVVSETVSKAWAELDSAEQGKYNERYEEGQNHNHKHGNLHTTSDIRSTTSAQRADDDVEMKDEVTDR